MEALESDNPLELLNAETDKYLNSLISKHDYFRQSLKDETLSNVKKKVKYVVNVGAKKDFANNLNIFSNAKHLNKEICEFLTKCFEQYPEIGELIKLNEGEINSQYALSITDEARENGFTNLYERVKNIEINGDKISPDLIKAIINFNAFKKNNADTGKFELFFVMFVTNAKFADDFGDVEINGEKYEVKGNEGKLGEPANSFQLVSSIVEYIKKYMSYLQYDFGKRKSKLAYKSANQKSDFYNDLNEKVKILAESIRKILNRKVLPNIFSEFLHTKFNGVNDIAAFKQSVAKLLKDISNADKKIIPEDKKAEVISKIKSFKAWVDHVQVDVKQLGFESSWLNFNSINNTLPKILNAELQNDESKREEVKDFEKQLFKKIFLTSFEKEYVVLPEIALQNGYFKDVKGNDYINDDLTINMDLVKRCYLMSALKNYSKNSTRIQHLLFCNRNGDIYLYDISDDAKLKEATTKLMRLPLLWPSFGDDASALRPHASVNLPK